jgi:hypothetical protein
MLQTIKKEINSVSIEITKRPNNNNDNDYDNNNNNTKHIGHSTLTSEITIVKVQSI